MTLDSPLELAIFALGCLSALLLLVTAAFIGFVGAADQIRRATRRSSRLRLVSGRANTGGEAATPAPRRQRLAPGSTRVSSQTWGRAKW